MAHPPRSSTTLIFTHSVPSAPHEILQPSIADNNIFKKIDEVHLTLTPVGREHIRQFLLEKRQLSHLTWSLNHLLHRLCRYFFRTFIGTEVELTSGTFYSAGKDFWKTNLEKEF